MHITLDQAIEIHAKVLKSRHGKGAIKSTGERATQCQSVGDFEGTEIWLRVKVEIERQVDDIKSEPPTGSQIRPEAGPT